MATIYSLVCWGGKDGRTVAAATTDIFTLTNNGLRSGTGVVPQSTTGGVTSGVTYFVSPITISTFYLYDTYANAIAAGATGRIDVASTISGLVLKGAYFLSLTTDQKARYGSSGSERIYDGLLAWRTARYSVALPVDSEIAEIGEAYTDTHSATLTVNIPSATTLITSRINGVRSSAFHGGVFDAGYICQFTSSVAGDGLYLNAYGTTVDGIQVTSKSATCHGFRLGKPYTYAYRCLSRGTSRGYGQYGFYIYSVAATVAHCLAYDFAIGFLLADYNCSAALIYNCLAYGNTTGFSRGANSAGRIYNSISVGNVTTNWSVAASITELAAYNIGASTDTPWNVGIATAITTGTTDMFTNVAALDFKPKGSAGIPDVAAVQVDVGQDIVTSESPDMADAVRPNYINGATDKWDIGPFEFDHGNGLAPLQVTIFISGMVSGSTLAIYKASDMSEIAAPATTTGSYSASYTYTGDTNIIVRVRKWTGDSKYLAYEYAGAISSAGFNLIVSQILGPIT